MITFLSSLNAMVSFTFSVKPSISTISPSPKSLCTTLSPMENFFMISLPVSLSINYQDDYQVKQVSREVAKKHQNESTYKNLNVHIKIIIPYIYLIKHLLHQFINGFLGISRFSEMRNHPMNNLTNSQIIFALNIIQILLILRGGAK